jgi:hypothetical protein
MTTARVPSFTGPYNLTECRRFRCLAVLTQWVADWVQLAGKPFDEPTVLRAAYLPAARAPVREAATGVIVEILSGFSGMSDAGRHIDIVIASIPAPAARDQYGR